MVFYSERALAILCPACQRTEVHVFSLFAISQGHFQLVCSCGFSQGHLRRVNKNFELDVLIVAGERARIRLVRTELFCTPLLSLFSPLSGDHLGYLGYPREVENIVAESSSLLPMFGNIVNPEIMSETLEVLQGLAEQQKIRCDCEHSSIGIDVYADRVDLVCAFCGSVVQIDASRDQHLEELSRVTEIIMEPSTSRMLGEWLKPLT